MRRPSSAARARAPYNVMQGAARMPRSAPRRALMSESVSPAHPREAELQSLMLVKLGTPRAAPACAVAARQSGLIDAESHLD